MEENLPEFVQPLGHGVYAIDTGFQRPRFDAAYLVVERGHAAFIDTGTNFALPRHLAALEALGISRDAVDWVIPTHVHLDHAGGSGVLMRELPRATLLVHPRGARHLVDPSALYAGALEVYGAAEMERSYGELVGVDPARVRASVDGETVDLVGRSLEIADTPGHARHHHCIWDATSRGWFTGDTFGLSYREFDTPRGAFALPTTTPVQFEPEPLKASIARLVARDPAQVFVTHYGRVGDPRRVGADLVELVDAMVAIARRLKDRADRQAALEAALGDLYVERAAAHGVAFDAPTVRRLLDVDIRLNAQGIGVWLDRGGR
ncbi:MAG TPA: MBL fold metallo-hydrolase [Burkholderiaceae bacterium]|nr:MBL fold metallo-hydrolase [Burkholderiaceae bacterium]